MHNTDKRVSSGIPLLDQLLEGLFIGDNVIWYDDAGSLAAQFCQQLIAESGESGKSLVYVSFDRSPKNLVEKLGALAQNQELTILDCFTNGKGDKAQVFNKFYEKDGAQWPYPVIKVNRPQDPKAVSEAIYGIHKRLTGDVRFVFESLSGMADLWDGEEHILKFYSHTCPKLYELDTIAYWIIEKAAHSEKLKAHINQVAQVAIDLCIDRGTTKIKILKAENRFPKALGRSFEYTFENNRFALENRRPDTPGYDLGASVKNFRKSQGMSQKELASLVKVTASNISQIESGQVFPSIPALFKIATHLNVDVASFFREPAGLAPFIFPLKNAASIALPRSRKGRYQIQQLTPLDLDGSASLFLVTLFAEKKLGTHFFQFKGEEAGFVISGDLKMTTQGQVHSLSAGDSLYLKTRNPEQWQNTGDTDASLLWIKIK